MQTPDTQDPQIQRRGFGLRREILPLLAENYKSGLVENIRSNNHVWAKGRVTFHLAREFGFCYGVDKAIDFAYETRTKFPDRNIYITNEIIHNPTVNRKMQEMGIRFLNGPDKADKGLEDVEPGDIILIPAFGTTVAELEDLKKKGCLLVDTTCGSVVAVWKRVEKYAADGFTALIHGKYNHEETQATSSRAGKYLVVRDKEEAQNVCDYIVNGGDRERFLACFAKASSPGFDPDRDLERLGCANQTTMLSSESLEIANMLQEAMTRRYGAEALSEHFRHFDTICSATQERQDAVLALLAGQKLDLMIVIGGYNSSNTSHLLEIAQHAGVPGYHVKDAACIRSKGAIEHKLLGSPDPAVTTSWLPEGKIMVGITAGASTPNRIVEEVIVKISEVANL
jgi:4-hydroxy-3-methylbut-2-enyl diphosphate reductase